MNTPIWWRCLRVYSFSLSASHNLEQFEEFFDVITLSYEHGYVKPHPSIFMTTLEKLKVNPNQSLHVGDDPIADIQGARNIGMKTVFVNEKEAKTNAGIEVKRITELTTLL